MNRDYFQKYMPGDVCFGCGSNNASGLHVHSYWQGDEALCQWMPQLVHQGWEGVTCGGIIATLIDCHCMATAMATAIRNERRDLSSEPYYRFATGSMSVKYLKPTPSDREIELRAKVIEIKNEKKFTLLCQVYSEQQLTAEANVVAFLVHRSDQTATGIFA